MAAALRYLRALLILGRVSNVPTVWSNCLAGWLLTGGGEWDWFALLCFAATCLYVGGMFLNDAFDAQFDVQHRPERPIPSGLISVETVWTWGFIWLGTGLACLFLFNPTTIICALLLAVAILVYDAIHKIFAFSPVLMAVCRFLLLLLAASTGWQGITGLAIWTALVLGAYIIGLSYLARKESTLVSRGYWPCAFLAAPLVLAFVVITGLAIRTALVLGAYIIGLIYLARKESLLASLRYWPCAFLAAPLVLAFVVNQGEHHLRAVILCLAIGLWMLRCLRFAFWSAQRNIGRCVAGLLAGIPLVDLLSVWDGSPLMAGVFLGLFVLALVFQRYVPAT